MPIRSGARIIQSQVNGQSTEERRGDQRSEAWSLVAKSPSPDKLHSGCEKLLSSKRIHWFNARSSTRGHKARHRGAGCKNSHSEKQYGRIVGPDAVKLRCHHSCPQYCCRNSDSKSNRSLKKCPSH